MEDRMVDEFKLCMTLYEHRRDELEMDGYRDRQLRLDILSECAEQIFQAFADSFDEHEVSGDWESWIDAQAWLFWQYKGAPMHQPKEGVGDDKMQAKRYLGYLVAQHLLSELGKTIPSGKCPVDILSAARVKYLLPLSVEEFVRIRSYFSYKSRLARNGCDDPSQHHNDYSAAADAVYQALRRLVVWPDQEDTKCRRCGRSLTEVHKNGDKENDGVEKIKAAKKRALDRLGLANNVVASLVDRCVDSLYPWLKGVGLGGVWGAVPPEPSRCLCSHFAVANMFEFFVMCFLAHSMDDPFPNFPNVPKQPPATA
jgi:hypothetical protein